jgi:peptidoglycan lytic transglycosylase
MRAKILAASIFCLSLATAPVQAQVQTGVASFYGRESGPHTASGERFDPSAMTAAHRTLPFGTLVRVTYQGRSVVVRINDRGPFVQKHGQFTRVIDLSEGAARRIGLPGVGPVTIEVLRSADWGVF